MNALTEESRQERAFQTRMSLLRDIESHTINPHSHDGDLLRQELRHRIRDRNYRGFFLPMVCDHCHSNLWQPRDEKYLGCTGCGWKE